MDCTSLPSELIDMIIDHLHDDPQSLLTCSLVCHSWVTRTRHHLFADLALHDTHSLAKLAKFESAAIPFVRNVHITGNPYANHAHPPSFFRFTNVKSLSLAYFPWCSMAPETRSTFLGQFAPVVRLYLKQSDPVMSSQLVHIFDAFPGLETLVIYVTNTSPKANVPPATTTLRPPRRLRALELWDPESHLILEWFLSLERHLPPIHTFYLHQHASEDEPVAHDILNRFLHALGPSLEVFRYLPHGYDHPLDLRHNTRLRSFHFDLWDASPALTSWLTQSLLHIAAEKPQHIEHIGFTVALRFPPSGDDDEHGAVAWRGTGPDWSEVDWILTEPPLAAKLKCVDIGHVRWTHARDGPDTLHMWGLVHLPRCHARGILRVHSVEWTSTFL